MGTPGVHGGVEPGPVQGASKPAAVGGERLLPAGAGALGAGAGARLLGAAPAARGSWWVTAVGRLPPSPGAPLALVLRKEKGNGSWEERAAGSERLRPKRRYCPAKVNQIQFEIRHCQNS